MYGYDHHSMELIEYEEEEKEELAHTFRIMYSPLRKR
jgi:hypothetical protein